ncbi:MAG: four helix bundle protein [Proteobacteria bacterium]|nr:four helix bundle protein [Pseudomonadota bacterium]
MSIPINIAEGYGRKTTPEYLRSLFIAYGSTCEPKQRAHSSLLAAGLVSELKTDNSPHGRRFPRCLRWGSSNRI